MTESNARMTGFVSRAIVSLSFAVLFGSGCSFFQSPESRIVGLLGDDCVDNYAGWSETIKDSEDEDELVAVFDEMTEYQLDMMPEGVGLLFELSGRINEMGGGEREDFHKEWLDQFVDAGEDCSKAEEEFREELRDNEDACEAFFDWREDKQESWEDFDEALEEYDEDCDEDCVDISLSGEKPFEEVPFPEGLDEGDDKDDCED